MKRILCGTTSLVAAALIADQASAASGIQLGLGGFFRGAAGFLVNQSDDPGQSGNGHSPVAFREENRIDFQGALTLDNGVTASVLVAYNAERGKLRGAYVGFSGRIGDLRFGEQFSTLVTNCVVDPGNVTANFGVNSSNESFSNAGLGSGGVPPSVHGVIPFQSLGTCFGIETDKGTKIVYFTPIFDGFSFGLSYAPNGGRQDPGGQATPGTPVKNLNGRDILSAVVNYTHAFGDATLTTGGGGGTGHDDLWGVALDSAYAIGPGIALEGQIAYAEYDAGGNALVSTYHGVEIDLGTPIGF